ncbi:MAG TPA: YceI family protein [Wenzhouxiangella sp.]|nr:YceI family protein [Wenzhouxiangella sp.]
MRKLSPLVLALCVLAACQTMPPAPEGVSRAISSGASAPQWPQGQHFVVDRQASSVRLIVRAEGPMARLGHPHVIGGQVIEGEVVLARSWRDSALRLAMDVSDLAIDRSAWRAAEGFAAVMDGEAVEGTRRNMLSPALLDAEAHPEILIESIAISGPRWQPDIRVLVTLAGQAREVTVPVALTIDDQSLTATGRFVILQSDFGLTPYATAGGALRVADEVLIRFRIVARPSG